MRYLAPTISLILLALCTMAEDHKQTDSKTLWAEFVKAPYTHPNIPNVAFAGYHFSESAPAPKGAIVNVRDLGAKADGKTDDAPAIKAAIAKASAAGGGIVLLPAGEYLVNDVLAISTNGVVLRGEGSGKTTLRFPKPISEIIRVPGAWYGGLIWVEPDGPVAPEARIYEANKTIAITKPAKMGEFVVEVSAAEAAELKPLVGQMVQMVWKGDLSMCMHMAGHESMRAYDWSSWGAFRNNELTWTWSNRIEKVDGTRVTLKKPLRLDIRPEWTVAFGLGLKTISEVGIEGIAIRFPLTKKAPHLKEPGYNGILFRRTTHCWVKDVLVENTDTAVNISGECVNNTVTGLKIIGRPCHHATMMRGNSHDNLIEDFTIECQPHHGLNTEGTSSGNVWRKGLMKDGTFDSHCMMSFDSVRTQITVKNSGGPGGASTHGPFVGRRMAHWNIQVTNNKGEWIAQPAILPSGAIVGIQGAPLNLQATKLWHMPDGLSKGCVVADMGKVPAPADLFQGQLDLRLKSAKP